jgi:hypothetical protein
MLIKIPPLLLILSALMSSYSFGETVANSGFSFSAPTSRQVLSEKNRCTKNSLQDLFPIGAKVILVSQHGIYGASIAEACNFSYHGFRKGSQLTLNGEDSRGFRAAIVGVDIAEVRLAPLKKGGPTVSQYLELRARRVVAEFLRHPNPPWLFHVRPKLLKSSPEVFRAGQAVLFLFDSERGKIPVLTVKNKILVLGDTYSHILFYVNDKLHLTCGWQCLRCSDPHQRIYDLSGEKPRLVWCDAIDPGD